jgi:glyoxylase-like metal-dependent hydrolase (beta-lactamase superfamily II)
VFHILDLQFQGAPEVIASYALRGPRGVAVIETGPASTYPALQAGLDALGIALAEVTDILVTHIHLDHAGAAGWLARDTGATVHVHHVGAPHLADPSRLLSSAQRIYGDLMDTLWGDTLPVPAGQVHALADGDVIDAAGLSMRAVDTPGHAYHHMAYLQDGLCFTGDVAAVRLPGCPHLRVPTPPPELDVPAWHDSLARLRSLHPDRLLLTHFGPATDDPQAHLETVGHNLDAAADFVHQRWQDGETPDAIAAAFAGWAAQMAAAQGADPDTVARYEIITPSPMLVQGLLRYWRQRI